jgi:co-chaperonin GroES (HSP10)
MSSAVVRNFSSPLTSPNATEFAYESLKDAFPEVDPGLKPFGTVGVFQIRQPKTKTAGGIIIDPGSQSTEHYNTQIAKVIALGPLCFKTRSSEESRLGSRETLIDWAEGPWFKIGDFVRVPRYGGDRFAVVHERKEMVLNPESGRMEPDTVKEDVIFALFKVSNILGLVDDKNALKIKAYLD